MVTLGDVYKLVPAWLTEHEIELDEDVAELLPRMVQDYLTLDLDSEEASEQIASWADYHSCIDTEAIELALEIAYELKER